MAMGNLTKDIGGTGLDENMGYIREDFLTEWRTTSERVKRIDEMLRNSPIIAALRMAIEMPIRDVEWFFTSDEGEEDPRLELLNDSLDNLRHSWNDHVVDALLMAFYGWSTFSITYERVGGRMLWRKFKPLGHNTVQRWLLEEDGGIAGLQQWPHIWPAPIPIERMVLYRFRKTRNNPEGESILRPAWTSWYYSKNIQHIEAIGIERNIAGMPVIELPFGADPTESTDENTDYGRANSIVRRVRSDEQGGLVLPPPVTPDEFGRWKFSLVTAGGMSKVIDTDMVISRYEKRMLMSALAQFLMLGMDNVGALATASGQLDFFTMAVNSIADIIAETFTKYPVERLLRLNGLDASGIKMQHGRAGVVDFDKLSSILQASSPYITITPEDELWIRDLLRMPEKELDEIADLREEAAEQNALMMANMQQPQERDEMDTFAAGNAPDDDDRLKFERTWQSKMSKYWREQRKRITGAVNA